MMTATHSSSPNTTKACNGLRPSLGFHWFIYPSLTTYQLFDSIMWRIKKQFWYYMCIMAYMIYTYIDPKHDSGRPVIYKWATSYLCLINQRADVLWIWQFTWIVLAKNLQVVIQAPKLAQMLFGWWETIFDGGPNSNLKCPPFLGCPNFPNPPNLGSYFTYGEYACMTHQMKALKEENSVT